MTHSQFAATHFNAATLRKLAKAEIFVLGLEAIPDMTSSMPWANARTGYFVSDKGMGRVFLHAQVKELVS